MDRDQLGEHLRFAAELGVAGISRDPAWRRAADSVGNRFSPDPQHVAQNGAVSVADRPKKTVPDPISVFSGPAESLAGVRADIGDCTRCKLHTLGRRRLCSASATRRPI